MRGLLFILTCITTIQASAIDFQNDIIPVLTKAGCNTGACHGAAVGRGGFRLSLYGGDASSDYRSIVRELEGRRITPAHPEQSLLVLKPTETMEHGGGQRLDSNGEGTQRLVTWISQGAGWSSRQGDDNVSPRQFVRLTVSPQRIIVSSDDPSVRLTAAAHFSDGSQREVTKWTVFTPEDPSSVSVDEVSGEATIARRGRHIVVARYLSEVVPIEIILPLADEGIVPVQQAANGFIDRHLVELLSTLRIPPSPAAEDATFLRRVTLDLTGRLPSVEAMQSFAADVDPNRRQRLVDQLLDSEAFNEYWTLQLAKLLRVHAQPQDVEGATAYHHWLRQQLADHAGYDRLARDLLTALGDSHEIGPANFYRTVAGPREQAELTSEVFMGNRLRCANCHNHPLDRWTQDDYHGLAAIFAGVRSGQVVSLDEGGVVIHPRSGDNAVPRIPGERFLDQQGDSAGNARATFADWLTDRENPYFAKAIVNRLWKGMMGRGLVEPADDLRATNPATHPALLDQLADDFAAHGYDLRHTLRLIAQSDAYGRSSDAVAGNENDSRFCSHFPRKPLQPEVLADAISDVLELSEAYGQHPLGTRAVSLVDPKTESRSLDMLGRCDRVETCETSESSTGGGLPLKLHLFNGELLNRRIGPPGGRLARLTEAGKSPLMIVDEFYVVALQRHPREAELAFWETQLGGGQPGDRVGQTDVLEDFVWSLLTCNEFITNH